MTDTITPAPDPQDPRLRALEILRQPFEGSQISYLPKQVRKGDQDRYNCIEGHPDFRKASKDGRACGGWHAWSVHLDYVGHAAITDRLLEADPLWDWEPLATDAAGLPLYDRDGGLWIRLTVAGTTRLGYGDAQGKSGPNAVKEIIGDALRNAGMRFGMALDLWHKGDLHEASEARGSADAQPVQAPQPNRRATNGTQGTKRTTEVAEPTEPPAPPTDDAGDPAFPPREEVINWVELLGKATTLRQIRDVWETAEAAGELTTDLKERILKRKADAEQALTLARQAAAQ